jgi:hypothetical protein
MDERRERRERGTADETLVTLEIIQRVYGDAAEIEYQLQVRARECAANGHNWFDPKTRVVCLHCGSAWRPEQE